MKDGEQAVSITDELRDAMSNQSMQIAQGMAEVNQIIHPNEAENTKLRRLSQSVDRVREAMREYPKLKAENDRLRALLQDVAICASGNYCYDCPHQHDGCDRDERLRAEGIEVPE